MAVAGILGVMIRFLHTADWQLGMTRHYLSSEAQARFSTARLDVIEQIGKLAVDEDCPFVVVCGDVFESNHVERQVLVRAFEKMAVTPAITFYLLPGNHDTLDASSIYNSPTFVQRKPDNVVVLGTEPIETVPGVELIPAPWPNKHPTTDLVGVACERLVPSDSLRVVVGHGAVDIMSPSTNDPKLIALKLLEDKISSRLIHYVALGDRHSTTNVGASGKIWYAGAPEPTDFNEVDPGNVLIVDLDEGDFKVDARRVGTWRFVRREWQISADADIDALEEWLSKLGDKDRSIVRVSFVGQISVAQKARLERLLDHNTDLFAALDTHQSTSELVVNPDDADLNHFDLSGFAEKALFDLRDIAESGDDAPAAREALTLLYRLVGSRT